MTDIAEEENESGEVSAAILTASAKEVNVAELFRMGESIACRLERGEIAPADSKCKYALSQLQKCNDEIKRLGLFSKNEDLSDVKTSSLRFGMVDFYMGQLTAAQPVERKSCGSPDMNSRLRSVTKACIYYTMYVDRCKTLGVLTGETSKMLGMLNLLNEKKKAAAAPVRLGRDAKIAQHRRRKAMRERIEKLRKMRSAAAKEGRAQDEDSERELAITVMRESAETAIDALVTLRQEQSMLKRIILDTRRRERDALLRGDDPAAANARRAPEKRERRGLQVTHIRRSGANQTLTSNLKSPFIRAADLENRDVVAPYIPGTNGSTGVPPRPGFASSSSLEVKREIFKNGVFRPDHNLPTMSLEEFARLEVAEAKRRSERAKNAPKGPRRSEQLHKDGDEDDEALADEAAKLDREWDDWKDANPKGSGLTKRF